MKKVFLTFILFMALYTPSQAYVYFDFYGAHAEIQGAKNLLGGGGAFGVTVIDNFSFVYKGMYALASRPREYFGTRNYNYMLQLAGIGYVYNIPYIHLGWRSSVMAGYSQAEADGVDRQYNMLKAVILNPTSPQGYQLILTGQVRKLVDSGPAVALWTGLQFDLISYVAPFIDVGLHKSFYSGDLGNKNIIGLNVLFGIRLTLGKTNSLEEGY